MLGMVAGTGLMMANHFTSAVTVLHWGPESIPVYIAIVAVFLNFIVSILGTLLLSRWPATRGVDQTTPVDYDAGSTP